MYNIALGLAISTVMAWKKIYRKPLNGIAKPPIRGSRELNLPLSFITLMLNYRNILKISILSNCKTYRAGGFTARASFGESKFFRHLFWRAKCAEFHAEKFSRLCACPQISFAKAVYGNANLAASFQGAASLNRGNRGCGNKLADSFKKSATLICEESLQKARSSPAPIPRHDKCGVPNAD